MEMISVSINKTVGDIFEKIPMKVLIVEAVLLGLYLYSASLVYSFSKPTFASLLLLYLMGNFFILCSYVKPSALLRSIDSGFSGNHIFIFPFSGLAVQA